MPERSDLKQEIARLKALLSEERAAITNVTELMPHGAEREAGIWEYDFDDLEVEMWHRFSQLEEQQDCISEEDTFPSRRIPAAILRRLKKLYRSLSGPLARGIIDKRKQFNLDQQNLLNKESTPFYLALILTMQKVKDRLNVLEESLHRIEAELDERNTETRGMEKAGSGGDPEGASDD